MGAITNPGTQTFDAPREHRSYRLDARLITVIEDIAMGVEAGDSGLKSCSLGAVSAAAAGAGAAEVNARHHRETTIIEDEDECFDRIGELLANGFTFEEVAKMVSLGGGATHLLALERWCDRVRLSCDADAAPESPLASYPWSGSTARERARRGHRAMTELRGTAAGVTHAAVLHIVYGFRDPFVDTLPPEVVVDLGPEFVRLARYTDAVEAKRQEMIRSSAARGAKKYVPASERAHPQHFHEKHIIGLSAAIAHANEASEVFRLAAVHGLRHNGSVPAAEGYQLFDLERARSLTQWFDRCLTSGDALRAAVATPRARHDDETKEQYREHVYTPARDLREAFLTAVKVDANRMLTDASLAFHAAWLRS